jgi:hypothetical protein
MNTSSTLKFLGLMLLGCSSEHTIASEVLTEQSVVTEARQVCVDMCDYAVKCGQIADSDLAACETTCESDCNRLEIAFPQHTIDINTNIESSSELIIERVSSCYLASECSLTKEDACYPEYIGFEASYYERVASSNSGGIPVRMSGSTGTSNCGMLPDLLSCETKMEQAIGAKQNWSLTCDRPNTDTQEWTCHCFENGVEIRQVTQVPGADAVSFDKLCWTASELACFNAGQPDC